MSSLIQLATSIEYLIGEKASITHAINQMLNDPQGGPVFFVRLQGKEGKVEGPQVPVEAAVGIAAYQNAIINVDKRIADSRKKLAELLEKQHMTDQLLYQGKPVQIIDPYIEPLNMPIGFMRRHFLDPIPRMARAGQEPDYWLMSGEMADCLRRAKDMKWSC